MFWTNDLSLLFQPELVPTDNMTFDQKANALSRMTIFLCIIFALVLHDTRIVVLMIILLMIIYIIQKYVEEFAQDTEEFLVENKIDVVDNKICSRPTKHNPFMNPSLSDTAGFFDSDVVGACQSYTPEVEKNINTIYDEGMYINSDDIYNRDTGKRQFYTVPGSKIPNDQSIFANWLYNRGKTCKENNGVRCFTNMYRDLRT